MKSANSRADGRRRVAVFGSYGPSLTVFRGSLIRALVAKGYQVSAIAPHINVELAEELRQLGAEPVALPLRRASLSPLAMVAEAATVRRVLRSVRPDAVIAYTAKPIILAAWATRRSPTRLVAMITGLGYAFTQSPRSVRQRIAFHALSALYRRALRSAGAILFQNPDDRAVFATLNLLPHSAPVSLTRGSGVELDKFAAEPVPANGPFLMIARLLGNKGVREYGEACARLRKEFPQARCQLAGSSDPSPDALSRNEIKQLEQQGVELLGHLQDVRPALARCRVYVLPSYREGTPRSSLEALATGRAIVTTDAPGCRETVVDGENGLLVPPADADALLAAMRRFMVEPELANRMGEASRQLAEERFDVCKVNAVIMEAAGL